MRELASQEGMSSAAEEAFKILETELRVAIVATLREEALPELLCLATLCSGNAGGQLRFVRRRARTTLQSSCSVGHRLQRDI